MERGPAIKEKGRTMYVSPRAVTLRERRPRTPSCNISNANKKSEKKYNVLY